MKGGSWTSPVFGLIGALVASLLVNRAFGQTPPCGAWLAIIFATGALAGVFAGTGVRKGSQAGLRGAVAGLLPAVVPVLVVGPGEPTPPGLCDWCLILPPEVTFLFSLVGAAFVGPAVGGLGGQRAWSVIVRPRQQEDGETNVPS